MRSAYEILGVDSGASEAAIRDRYLSLVKVLHPDVCKRPTATQEFKAVQQAYKTLTSPHDRQHHDYALARIAVADVPDDMVDAIISSASIEKVLKKKKKKKKKKTDAEIAQETQAFQQFRYAQPSHPVQHGMGNGQGEFEGIPDGYEDRNNLGGIL